MTETGSANRLRRSARVILLDDRDHVLLIRFVLPRRDGDYLFWATPGGEIEGAETPIAAARRELSEELGLDLALEGPVHHAHGTFEFLNETVDNDDDFFVAHWAGGPITLDGVDEAERHALKEVRWWSPEDIDAATQPVYPPDLADVVRRLTSGETPDWTRLAGSSELAAIPPYKARRGRVRSVRPVPRQSR